MPVVLNHSVCLLLLLMAICETAGKGKPITCHAGTFAPGQPAAVTCNLHAVGNATGSGVHVVRYRPGAPQFDPGENVLVCAWVEGMQRHHCDVEIDGYTLSPDSHSPIAVTIASVRDEFTGLYVCFLVPSDGTQAHPCELIVRGGRVTLPQTTTPEATIKKNEAWMIGFIMILITAVISVAATIGLCGLYWRRRSARKPHNDDHVESVQLIPVVRSINNSQDQGQEDLQETNAYSDKRIMVHLKRFLVGPEQIKTLIQAAQEELGAYSAPQTTSNNMFCTTVKALPKRTETGDVLVINLSSTCLKVVTVKLRGEDINTDDYMTYRIPADVRTGTSKQLMEFIADRVSMFLKSKALLKKHQSVGCVLSFPCKYDKEGDLTTARIARWTKGFRCKDVVDSNWKDLLQRALQKKKVGNLETKVIVNDIVALFMSALRDDDKCSIAVGLGNGFSACYLQHEEDQFTSTEKVIISTEFGALGEDGSLDDFRTEFDRNLDLNTVNSNKQILEKMISRLYLGEIVRLVLLKLIKQGLLFSPVFSEFSSFNEKGSFSTEHVALIQSDTSADHSVTKDVLHNLEVDQCNAEDCNIVQYVCRIVFQRSAFLAAAAISTLVKHVKLKEVTIAVDGSLYRSHPRFGKLLEAKTQELVGPECKVTFLAQPGRTGIGAALTAAISMSAETDQDTPSTKTH